MKASWLDTEKQLQKFNTAELQNLSLSVFWGLVYFCYLFYSKQWHGGMKFCQALEKFRLHFLPPFSSRTHTHIGTPKHIHTLKYKKRKKKRNKYTVNVWVVIWTLLLVFFIFFSFCRSHLYCSSLLSLLSSLALSSPSAMRWCPLPISIMVTFQRPSVKHSWWFWQGCIMLTARASTDE